MLPESPADVSTSSSAEGQARLTVKRGEASSRLAGWLFVCAHKQMLMYERALSLDMAGGRELQLKQQILLSL